MGWAGGSSLCWEVIKAAKKAIPDKEKRAKFYESLIVAFENEDCDTLHECWSADPVFKKTHKTMRADDYDD